MITGDKQISTHNNEEINALTNENNKEGNQIKVVLISKAGAEGLDFKYIRQVHILEPWYNLSRIEQIIGRAVRNFSHKDLPFVKRNVEIFMHGTILSDPNEEAADLYLYRIAEYKAKQIGQVSRLLKESSVDCLLNESQGNFSQEYLTEYLEKKGINIVQVLSNGKKIDDFKIGDLPYSANCDYMQYCNYKCFPYKKIDEKDVTEDSYTASFMETNSDKIMQKIRDLMKEQFFYKKSILIKKINYPKVFPLVEIYAALTNLIDEVNENNEYIIDKYGRNGTLKNIGDYYVFQPLELSDPNITIFDRSVPIDGKHDKITISMNYKEEEHDDNLTRKETPERKKQLTIPEIFKELESDYNKAIEVMNDKNIKVKGENDFYKYCGISMRKLMEEPFHIERKILEELLVEHIVDVTNDKNKLELLNYVYAIPVEEIKKQSLEYYVKEYFDKQIIKKDDLLGLLLNTKEGQKIITFKSVDSKWENGQPEDYREILEEFEKKYGYIKKETTKYLNKIVGFIDYEKLQKYLVFKTIDLSQKRNTGARCDESSKGKKIILLNDIIGEEKYNKENTKGMVEAELCSLQELLLRYYNRTQKNEKIWFLYPELAKFILVKKISN